MSNCFWLTQYTISIEPILDAFMEKNREKILAVYQVEYEPQETTLDKIRTMNRENIHRLTDHLPSLKDHDAILEYQEDASCGYEWSIRGHNFTIRFTSDCYDEVIFE